MQRSSDRALDDLANLFVLQERLEEAIQRHDARIIEVARLRAGRDEAAKALEAARSLLAKALGESEHAGEVEAEALRASRRSSCLAAEEAYRAAELACQRAQAREIARERDRLRESLGLIGGWRAALNAIGPTDERLPIPAESDLAEIRKADREFARLGAELAGDGLTLRFVAEGHVSALISEDGRGARALLLTPGDCAEGEGVASLAVEIAGVGRVEIGRTAASVVGRVEARERLRSDLSAKLDAFGASDVEELESRRARDAECRRLHDQIDARLAGVSPEALEARLADLERSTASLAIAFAEGPSEASDPAKIKARRDEAFLAWKAAEARCEGDRDAPVDSTTPTAEDASRLVAEAVARLDRATHTERAAERALIRVEEALRAEEAAEAQARSTFEEESGGRGRDDARGDFRRRIEVAQQPLVMVGHALLYQNRKAVQVKRAEIRKDVETARRDFARADPASREAERCALEAIADRDAKRARWGEILEDVGPPHDLSARLEDLHERERRWLKASVAVGLLRERLPADPDADAARFATDYEAAHRACDEGEVELRGLRAELDVEGAQGLDGQHARAEEDRDLLEGECRRLGKDAAAWALLHHLLAEVEEQQSSRIATRLEQLASTSISRLTKGNVVGVKLDPCTLALSLGNSGRQDAEIDRFSRGTREQVALSCRLQIGRLLGREFRHMLLLDDPLAHTDPARHREALAELADLSRTLQVIVFTCHLDRYAPLFDEHGAEPDRHPRRALSHNPRLKPLGSGPAAGSSSSDTPRAGAVIASRLGELLGGEVERRRRRGWRRAAPACARR